MRTLRQHSVPFFVTTILMAIIGMGIPLLIVVGGIHLFDFSMDIPVGKIFFAGFVISVLLLFYILFFRPILVGLYLLFLVWWNGDYDGTFTIAYTDALPVPIFFKVRIMEIVLLRKIDRLMEVLSRHSVVVPDIEVTVDHS